MNKDTFIFQVGTHLCSIHNHTQLDVANALPSLQPFIKTSAEDGEEYLFELSISDCSLKKSDCPLKKGDATDAPIIQEVSFEWEDAQCTIRQLTEESHQVLIAPRGSDTIFSMSCQHHFRENTFYLPDNADNISFVLNNFLMMLYAFNGARHQTLLMHASVIVHNGKGYLFLGKSGTGKSTHTALWLKHIPGCHLLNDDNPVVHVDSSSRQVTVYGSPWSGKTPCYRNESVPIGAFVRLEQAPLNKISQENAVRAFAALLPSCSCLKQDKDIHKGVMGAVTELACLVPVFHLQCLPDKAAAELCNKTVVSD